MGKLTLLLSLAALVLVACGGDDDETTAGPAAESAHGEFTDGDKPCTYARWTLVVVTGDIACSEARGAMKDIVHNNGYSPDYPS
jgi:hypothetical protein